MDNKTLNLIALKVLKGRFKAALALPPESLLKVHILVSQHIKSAPEFSKSMMKNLHKYFLALPRFQCAEMWLVFLKEAPYERVEKWYHSEDHSDVICNSFFCAKQFKNGRSYSSDNPLVVKARRDSLNKVLNLNREDYANSL